MMNGQNDSQTILSQLEEEKGLEAIVDAWAFGMQNHTDYGHAFQYIIDKVQCTETELLKARKTIVSYCENNFCDNALCLKLIVQSAKLLHHVGSEFCVERDITSWLRDCAVPGFDMTEERIAEFSIRQMETEGIRYSSYETKDGQRWNEIEPNILRQYNFYLDMPIAVGLFHKNEPRAVVSVFPTDEETLQIRQIQGAKIKTKSSGERDIMAVKSTGGGCLGTLDWKRFLVTYAEQLGKDLDYNIISIQGARNNTWVKDKALSSERGREIYDKTAERLGYVERDDGNWYRKIIEE